MGEGRDHQKYEEAPLFRAVITYTYDPDITPRPHHYPVSGEFRIVSIKGPYNTPGPATAACNKALKEAERCPRKGETVSVRPQCTIPDWFDL